MCINCWIFLHSMKLAWQKRRLSSAKKKWLSWKPLAKMGTPDLLSSLYAFNKRELRPSAHRRKRYGDKGSPYLNLRVGEICLIGSPIDEDWIGGWTYTSHQQSYPLLCKAQFPHYFFKEGPFHSVISLAHIKLYGHEALLPFHKSVHGVECLISY